MGKKKKSYLARHAKSSAALVSLGIHAVLILVAVSFVAVSVINREPAVFEARPVQRPKMTLKKLQVPVNVKKKRANKPKLRKRLVAKPKVNQALPDIKMPEISGVKGAMGGMGGGGFGGAAALGFTMPELNVFGVKGKGEKVFIMLDASNEMMYDEMGGIPAYEIIKSELVEIIGGLPPTALFNVAVFDKWSTYVMFPSLVSASASNVGKVEEWLKPLNAVRPGMGVDEWGTRTLGRGGVRSEEHQPMDDFRKLESWHRPSLVAMRQQADTVFVLTSWWGYQRYPKGERDQAWFETSKGQRYLERYQEALAKYDRECEDRVARGEAPRVLSRSDKRLLVTTYFPGSDVPPEPEYYYHEPREYIKAMLEEREEHRTAKVQTRSGIGRSAGDTRKEFSFNVIRFVRANEDDSDFRNGRSVRNFKKMTGYFRGEYRELAGLEAIKSSVGE